MTDNKTNEKKTETEKQALPAAALRALAEAAERRQKAHKNNQPKEIGGRGDSDPSRYGDWEIKGRAIDF